MKHNTDIPSGRIRFALEALKEAEVSEFIVVDMDYYRTEDVTSHACFACLGGIAYLKSQSVDLNDIIPDEYLDVELVERFERSLDKFRKGRVNDGFLAADIVGVQGFSDRTISPYYKQGSSNECFNEYFYADMNTLADDLEKAGY